MAPDEERGVAILADGFLAGVISSGAAATHTSSSAVAPSFARLPDDRPFVVVPVRLGGETVALLYADQEMNAGTGDSPRVAMHLNDPWPAVIEALVRHAARCLEAVTATRAAQMLRRPAAPASPPKAPGASLAEARR
jgi:hypothetical protein